MDSTEPPSLEYELEEGVESLGRYRPGGYHPTHIGDQYHNGRYEIVHKLGFAAYSTVWLAHDHQEDRFVALKIVTGETSENSSKSKVLRLLSSGKQDHPGRNHVALLLDEFVISRPNGHHLCIVSEVAAFSMAESKEAGITWKFPIDVARSITAQVLLGLDYIHSCGVIHDDLHSHNILFRLESCSTEQLYLDIGEQKDYQ